MPKTSTHPGPSALSDLLSQSHAKTESTALPLEILYNLQHQHGWRDLSLHTIANDTSNPELISLDLTHIGLLNQTPRSNFSDRIYLISGLPPRHTYLHPDFQNQLLRQNVPEKSANAQREWVLPMSLGEKWTIKRFSAVFDALPPREALGVENSTDVNLKWKDAKRVLTGMLSTNGVGGDGTVVYYIMQEGEVKPRQNG